MCSNDADYRPISEPGAYLGLVGELLGPREADALNHARVIAQVERVVRLGRRRQQFRQRRAEDGAGRTHQLVAHFRHVRLRGQGRAERQGRDEANADIRNT